MRTILLFGLFCIAYCINKEAYIEFKDNDTIAIILMYAMTVDILEAIKLIKQIKQK